MSLDMPNCLRLMVKHSASDLFLSPGAPASLKINGTTRPMTEHPLTAETLQTLVYSVLTPAEIRRFEQDLEFNKALDMDGIGRFRINVFRQRGMVAMVARHIRTDIPGVADLHLPALLEQLVMEQRGLILITGAAGSGKSTTMAAMIEYRNLHRTGHILMIEDPVEFIHNPKKSIVDQREIGLDTHSFGNALRNAMREAPDVIAIGEIRDFESLRYALAYAETGHLCLATLHASNAHQSLFRLRKEGTISKEEALTHADSRANLALKFRLDHDSDAKAADPPRFDRFL